MDTSRSICYVRFSGNGEDFNKWKVETLVLARCKKFDIYLKEDNCQPRDLRIRLKLDKCITDSWDQSELSLTGPLVGAIQEVDENAHMAGKILLR